MGSISTINGPTKQDTTLSKHHKHIQDGHITTANFPKSIHHVLPWIGLWAVAKSP